MLNFTRDEVESLIRTLRWVDTATLSDKETKLALKETAMKLQVALKSTSKSLDKIHFYIEDQDEQK
jgi:hypothetical protein|tara:strand:- start:373 stop:570 length:198 start_codon:yes stop_codon:yes gene_type:complete